MREKWAAILVKAKDATPMHPAWITHCLNEVKGQGIDGVALVTAARANIAKFSK